MNTNLPSLIQEIKDGISDLRKFEKLLDSVHTEEERKESIILLDKELTALNHKVEKVQLIHMMIYPILIKEILK